MKRRNFLRTAGLLSLPTLGGMPAVRAALNSPLRQLLSAESDRILIVVQLFGGNDGLNTLVPLDQLSALSAVRPTLLLPEDQLHKLDDRLGMHPAMDGMRDLYRDGKLTIVQSVGYPEPNRSHFRSSEIWATASAAQEELSTGWLGRYFDTRHPDYPDNYPNADTPDPVALTVGNVAHASCEGAATNYSQAILDPANVTFLRPTDDTPEPDDFYGQQLDFLRTTFDLTNTYGRIVQQAAERGAPTVEYPSTELGRQLRKVATLINGGLGTKVYTVNVGGFDNHADQVVGGQTTEGNHAKLLRMVSDAIAAFQADMEAQGYGERVLGFTYSEFGRRIRANASLGTDHGDAGPMFLFGQCAAGGILGDNVRVDPAVSITEGVPLQFDFRDVYGSILTDWFGAEEAEVRRLIHADFTRLPVIRACGELTSPTTDEGGRGPGFSLFPNPAQRQTTLEVSTERTSRIGWELRDVTGRLVQRQTERVLPAGQHRLPVRLTGRAAGVYVLSLLRDGQPAGSRRLLLRR